MKSCRSTLLSIAAAALAAFLPAAHAQTAIQPGSIVGTFQAQGYISGTPRFTAPQGKYSRITDILLINYSAADCTVFFLIGDFQFFASLLAHETKVIPLNSGYGLLPGETAGAGTPCAASTIFAMFRGYYFTLP